MKIAIILILTAIAFATFLSVLVNFLPSSKTNKSCVDLKNSQFCLRRTYSFNNACVINRDSSAPNRPVRPDGEEYFDGITAELTNERNDPLLAKQIINIRTAVDMKMG